MCIAMTSEGVLRNIFATGREDDTIVHIQCPHTLFSMRCRSACVDMVYHRLIDVSMTCIVNIILVYNYIQ